VMRRPTVLGALGAALAAAGCGGDPPPGPRPLDAPVIEAAAVAPNVHSVLSAVVSLRARHADSAAVRFRLADGSQSADSVTPAVPAAGDSAVIPVLGLLPASRYVARTVAYGPGGLTTGDPLPFATDTLPADLPQYEAGGSDPSPGYVVFAAGRYGVVIDNTGRVVWYRSFAPLGPGLSFMAEPAGRYVLRPSTPDPGDLEPWVEVDALGNQTRTLGCAGGLQPRPHDLIAERDGSYWLMCDETRAMDLTAVGGVADARVTGTVVQHVSAAGARLFSWSPFDHLQITDLDAAERTGASVNWTHGNALDFDAGGHLIVSFRSLSEVTSIDTATGAVLWRLGGRRNQFRFAGTPTPAFAHQHGVRASAPGVLVLLDNIGDPSDSRAERYLLDEAGRTATLVQAHGAVPPAVTQIGGSVQAVPGGRTLVSFGTAGRVEEYDSTGRVTWRITGNAGYVFRAQRIRSLYAPGAGVQR
jgi:Arylsulfotransferase (ASST)